MKLHLPQQVHVEELDNVKQSAHSLAQPGDHTPADHAEQANKARLGAEVEQH
jgi:hypothetical protein